MNSTTFLTKCPKFVLNHVCIKCIKLVAEEIIQLFKRTYIDLIWDGLMRSDNLRGNLVMYTHN